MDLCLEVDIGFWAPIGSPEKIPCPASGFYCPGKAADTTYGGARPILIPVGQSTTTETKRVVRKDVSLDMTCDEFNMTAMRFQLAEQFMVDVALVDLSDPCFERRRRRRALAGSLQITITISVPTSSPSSSSGNASAPTSLAAITAAVASVDDAALGAALGAIITQSTAPVQASVVSIREAICSPGFWCSAGYVTPCESGYFQPEINVDSASGCQACPLYATGPSAAVNISQCECANGFVPWFNNSVDATDGFKCICPAGTEKRGDAAGNVVCASCFSGSYKPIPTGKQDTVCVACPQADAVSPPGATSVRQCGCPAGAYLASFDPIDDMCAPCPHGALCLEAATPATLNLTSGRWRVSNASVVIETCDLASSCVGGIDTSASCAEGHTGPLCAVCADGYRHGSQGGCVACSGGDAIEFADVLPMLIMLSVLVPLVVACCRTVMRRQHAKASVANATRRQKRTYRETPKKMSQRVISSAIVKLKIMTAHQQVLQGLSGVFRITWPAAFKQVLAYMKVLNFDFISIVPLECVFPYNLCLNAARTARVHLPPPGRPLLAATSHPQTSLLC